MMRHADSLNASLALSSASRSLLAQVLALPCCR